MKYPVKVTFRDREGRRNVAGGIFETDDLKRAASLKDRRIIGAALPEPKAVEPPAGDVGDKTAAEYPISLPGGYYQLPDGSKVRGKKAALEAMRGGDSDEPA